MIQPTPRYEGVGVAVLVLGCVLVVAGLAAFWILLPLAGAALTVILGLGLAGTGARALMRPPK